MLSSVACVTPPPAADSNVGLSPRDACSYSGRDAERELIAIARSCPQSADFERAALDGDAKTLKIVARIMYEQANGSPHDVHILINAAYVIRFFHADIAISLLERAITLQRTPDLREQLAWLLLSLAKRSHSGERERLASLALVELRTLLESAGPAEEERARWYTRLADAALLASNLYEAEAWAHQALSFAERNLADGAAGNAFHRAHQVLGLVALRRHELPRAREHLRASCKGPTSAQLSTFGPKTRLAQELLARGARYDVIEFLTDCQRVWPRGASQLRQWITAIEAGRDPRMTPWSASAAPAK